jgi:HK97 gp10 family phage protein
VRIFGIPRAKAALRKVELEIQLAAPVAARAGGVAVAREMASLAPQNTGATASSIRVDTDGPVAHAGPTTPYARFPNFGTVYIAPLHWMEEAAERSHVEIVSAMATAFRAAIH